MTVKELKEILAKADDEDEVICFDSQYSTYDDIGDVLIKNGKVYLSWIGDEV